MSLRSALRTAISRCTQRSNSIIAVSSRDMTVLSKKSGEEYQKQVRRVRNRTMDRQIVDDTNFGAIMYWTLIDFGF